ncbi:MAG TPA: MFS transporter [Steroidobacteraceae bacterium]|nr:MFS transporter [Steroidobacteraceae bacterium]
MTDSRRVEVGSLIDSVPFSGLHLYVMLLAALCVMCDGFDLQALALTVPALSKAWSLPPPSFSAALSASLLGMGLGAAFIAPLGDRFGRRALLATALFVMGLGTLACVTAENTTELLIYRFITGIGIGGSMPNAFSLTADYLPRARRAALLTATYCNTATGAMVGSFSAPWLIERFGWQGTFIAGGALPIVVSILLLLTAPESLKFLLHRRPGHPGIARILRRIAPDVPVEAVYLQPPSHAMGGSLRDLFAPRFRTLTLWLWLGFAMNAFVLYLIVSWLPTLLTSAGWTSTQALHAAAFNQIGGIVGGISLAWLMGKLGQERTLLVSYLLCAMVLTTFLVAPSQFWTWGILLLLNGLCIGGAQFAIPTLGATYYPAAILSTGTGWASAIARMGAFLAPLLGGALLNAGLSTSRVLALLAIPALIAALAMYFLAAHARRRAAS